MRLQFFFFFLLVTGNSFWGTLYIATKWTILLSILSLQLNKHICVTMLICCYFNSWIRPSILSSRLVAESLRISFLGFVPCRIDRIHFRNQLLDITRERERERERAFIPFYSASVCIQGCCISKLLRFMGTEIYLTKAKVELINSTIYVYVGCRPFHGNLNSFWRYS